MILVDSREKLPYTFSTPFQVCKLDTGDYSLDGYSHIFTVDRKASVSELAGNLTQKRFKNELERMAKIPHSFLLLEFSFDDILRFPYGSDIPRKRWRYLKVKAPFIISSLSTISIHYGVQVIYAGNRDNARDILMGLFKAVQRGNKN
mgnify:CR=1 FL=1